MPTVVIAFPVTRSVQYEYFYHLNLLFLTARFIIYHRGKSVAC